MKTTRTFWSILTMLIVASLALAACGAPATEAPAAPEPTQAPAMTEAILIQNKIKYLVLICLKFANRLLKENQSWKFILYQLVAKLIRRD